jgi:glycosyltransferase involved in cell wall biosynthesis
MSKTVLIITYYWPPSGGAAVQRWLSLSNKLAQNGWQVHLLTVDEKWATYQLRDESLTATIHPSIIVHKTKTFEPFGLYKSLFGKNSIPKPAFANETAPSLAKKAARFVRGNLFIPDPRKGWKRYAIPKALELIDSYGIKNVITAGPPHSTHFTGEALKNQRHIKWIADFHDLWTDVIYYNMLYHLPVVKSWDRALEKRILEGADVVLTVGEKYKQKLLQKSHQLKSEKIGVLRIGYDETLFEMAVDFPKTDKFTITYTGSMADFYQPQVFFKALSSIVKKHGTDCLRLRFVGVFSGGIKASIEAEGLVPIFEETGYIPHQQSIAYLLQSDALLLVNPVTKDEAMVIPGKLYEYLAAQKPIINITTKAAETATIIAACHSGETFERTEQKALEAYLEALFKEWRETGKNNQQGNNSLIAGYSHGVIAVDLIKHLEG